MQYNGVLFKIIFRLEETWIDNMDYDWRLEMD